MASDKYVIRGGIEGRARLRLLASVMEQSTLGLLAEVGIAPGSKCLDVGCGGGDVTFELARQVGPTGRVAGVDLDETKIELARQEREQLNLPNVTLEAHDVTKWEPDGKFDVIYSRFLLTHMSDPRALLTVLSRHLRSGGAIIIEDIDFRGHFAEPSCQALDRLVEFYTQVTQNRGADPHIGPKLPGLLRDTGFKDIQMRLFHPAALEGGIKQLTCMTLESIAGAVLKDGIATEADLRQTIEELYAFACDPETIIGGPHIFQVWGRSA
jgi:precorrin-6B methylase 2